MDMIYVVGVSYETGNSCSTFDATTLFYGASAGVCSGRPGREAKKDETPAYPVLNSVVFPNPFSSKATFRTGSETAIANSCLIIYDMMGKEVKRIGNINTKEIEIDKGGMLSGIYFFRYIQNGNELSKGKFVISQ